MSNVSARSYPLAGAYFTGDVDAVTRNDILSVKTSFTAGTFPAELGSERAILHSFGWYAGDQFGYQRMLEQSGTQSGREWVRANNAGTWTAWKVAGSPDYISPAQSAAAAQALSFAHGLGGKPSSLDLIIVCNTADKNHQPGDVVVLGEYGDSPGVVTYSLWADAVNCGVTLTGGAIRVVDRSTALAENITAASWDMYLRAWT